MVQAFGWTSVSAARECLQLARFQRLREACGAGDRPPEGRGFSLSWPRCATFASLGAMVVEAFLALGANLGDPVAQIASAQRALTEGGAKVRRRARLYRSAPVGPDGQPDYVNTAVEVETELTPEALLSLAKQIEAEHGRTAGVRWGPRVLDIDIALYGGLQLETERLRIPHRELQNRRFVLAPLFDLAPELEVPGLGSVRALLAALPDDPSALEVLEDRVVVA